MSSMCPTGYYCLLPLLRPGCIILIFDNRLFVFLCKNIHLYLNSKQKYKIRMIKNK